MENRELKEYLNEFADDAKVSLVVANPEDRKVYQPEELIVMKDDELDFPCFAVKVGKSRNMDAEELAVVGECERESQPELPRLKNNDQRREFLKNFHKWPVWFEVPQADEVYYRYILPDGCAIVICEYKQYVEWKEKYMNEDPETTGTREYLLKPGYRHLHDCGTSGTVLAKKLMEVQRCGRADNE